MKKQAHKLLAVLLAVIMILSVVPFSTFTAFAETEGLFEYDVENGEATITGLVDPDTSGAIEIPATIGDYPVKKIDERAFYWCMGITSIDIPDSVMSIGDNAFEYCMSLESVNLSNSITSIGKGAFSECAITSISIPRSVNYIGEGSFKECNSLLYITVDAGNTYYHSSGNCLIETKSKTLVSGSLNSVIPTDGSVTSIGGWAFSGQYKHTSIMLPNSVTLIGEAAFCDCHGLTSITIPNAVTKLADSCFMNCSGLTSITIPDSVLEIGEYAFAGCSKLKAFFVPNSVKKIGEGVLSYCKGITSISVKSGNEYYNMAGNCLIGTKSKILIAGLANSIIPKDGSVEHIGKSAFAYIDTISSIEIPDSIISIGECSFAECHSLSEIVIPNSVITIGNSAFEGCSNLKSISISESVRTIGDSSFSFCASINSLIIPDSVEIVCCGAFSFCEGLKSVTIGSSVTEIGTNAFFSCENIENVYYNGSNESRDNNLTIDNKWNSNDSLLNATWHYMNDESNNSEFYYYEVYNGKATITGLVDDMYAGVINIPSRINGYPVTAIGMSAFLYCENITEVNIPDGVVYIDESAFSWCENLKSVYIPASVADISPMSFLHCNELETITVNQNNPYYYSSGNCIIIKDIGCLFIGCNNSTIPDDGSIKSIDSGAFAFCTELKSIVIPYGVEYIGWNAFSNCYCMQTISLPDTITKIGYQAFDGCDLLTDVYYSGTEQQRNNIDFNNDNYCNDSLINATWHYSEEYDPDYPEEPGDDIYQSDYYYYTVEDDKATIVDVDESISGDITLPSMLDGYQVIKIGDWAFEDCTEIITVTILESVTSIGNWAFCDCTGLTSIIIPDSVALIGWGAFCDCTGLESITISNSITLIDDYAFSGCIGLTSIIIPDSVTSIGDEAFYYCTGLKSITIPNSVTTIGNIAFYGCTELIDVYYAGTEQYKENMIIDYGNDYLSDAIWHYNYQLQTFMSGDINSDGKVNNKDLTRLFQYLSGWSVEVNETLLDINGDGRVNNKDVTRLFQYLSGWNVEIH